MIGGGTQRWAVSLADLLALLLGFFVLVGADARGRDRALGGIASALGRPARMPAATSLDTSHFIGGEARLTVDAGARIDALARRWRGGSGTIRVVASGRPRDGNRFDGWELTAARAAVVARRLRDGGVDVARIAVLVDTSGAGPATVEIAPAR